jgi:AcrR family transcriptional regulator
MVTPTPADAPRLDPRVGRTRQAVLATALQLLLDEGWNALTHARLASASGISRMTLYRHWPTRHQLLHDTLRVAADVQHAPISGDLGKDLKRELQLVRKQLLSPDKGKLLATLIQLAQSEPQIAELRDESVRDGTSGVTRILRDGMAAGSLPADLDVEAAVASLVGPLVYRVLVNGRRLTAGFVDDVAESFLLRFP